MLRRYSAMSLRKSRRDRERAWPEDLAPRIRSDVLEYFCNGQIDYRCAESTSGWRCPGIGRPSGERIPIKRSTAAPAADTRCGRVPRNDFGQSSTSWPRMISERRCSGALQSRANFHDLYDALLRQLSRTALHPRLQAHAPHHPAAHHLASSSTAIPGWLACNALGIREIGPTKPSASPTWPPFTWPPTSLARKTGGH
jgi:hypothetical protein